MTPQQRVAAAADLTDDVRALVEAGIRQRHPEYGAEAVQRALVDLLLGAELTAQVREDASRT